MTIQDFMVKIIVYYGEYENQELKKIVAGFVHKEIKPDELEGLLKTVYSYHKAIFKAPCIATIEECIDKARLKKGKYEPFRIKDTKTTIYQDYKEEKEAITEEEKEANIKEFKNMMKNVVIKAKEK